MLVELVEVEEEFVALANSDIAQLCAENILLWQQFLEAFSSKDSVHQHLARHHHQLRPYSCRDDQRKPECKNLVSALFGVQVKGREYEITTSLLSSHCALDILHKIHQNNDCTTGDWARIALVLTWLIQSR
uniref:Uncharacterized protein n=1 Tax=Timema monikensis TaxID=170555 RepID=A0A7R9HU98_9NEOP|nr:unnamed protein product [Timema monikensis]